MEAVIADNGASSLSAIARQIAIPVPTAHRHINALVRAGWLVAAGYGRHRAGPRLGALAHLIDEKDMLINAAAPVLERLAADTGCIVHLGTLDNDMVTYRLKMGRGSDRLFTKVGMQLEAYCSGIGKVLLAHLPQGEQSTYLKNGPFIALTQHTLTDPEQIRSALNSAASQGFAIDDEEAALGLQCVAVPVRNPAGRVVAAISASRAKADPAKFTVADLIDRLKQAAFQI